jgi:large subunit ribosomal protein L29
MDQKVITELTTAEIIERLDEEKRQIVKMRLNHAVSQLENPNKIRTYRKTIARLETELRKRSLEGAKNTPVVKK